MSGAMTEFRITSDLAALRGQVIDANFAEVKEWLGENLAPYRTMTVTEDIIPTAKSYRANIRKVKDRIDQSRKEAKNAALAAYTEFEAKCKELTDLCDEAANALDSQVKAFEQREKDAKIAALREVYDALTDEEVREYCPWGCINNPKWENKGYSAEDAKEEIKAAISCTESDLKSIREIGGDDTAYLLDVYRQTRDLNAVIRKSLEIKAAREREEQRRREAEERRTSEAKKADVEGKSAVVREQPIQEPEYAPAVTTEIEQDEMVTVDFRVICTKAQLSALGQYMKANGIRYGRCK